MLIRMYLRWAERVGVKAEVVDLLPGEEAGIKSATITMTGEYAYGYLKSEIGVHRLIRISPFDASKRRHTSFASVAVIPEVEDVEVVVRDDELRVDVYRSSGPGGQGVNTADSAVRITHLPTGIVVACQNERSQLRNRDTALRILRARLYQVYEKKQREELAELTGEKKEIAFGSQIRTYTFHPYQIIKDHRTGVEIGNVEAVMDGDIEPFIRAFLTGVRPRRLRGKGRGVMAAPPPSGPAPDTNELIRRRHDKLEALRARGIDPFGGRFPVSHWAGDVGAAEGRGRGRAQERRASEPGRPRRLLPRPRQDVLRPPARRHRRPPALRARGRARRPLCPLPGPRRGGLRRRHRRAHAHPHRRADGGR